MLTVLLSYNEHAPQRTKAVAAANARFYAALNEKSAALTGALQEVLDRRGLPAIAAGLSSYSPNSFGKPAFGCADTRVPATCTNSAIQGLRSSAPNAQLSPIMNGSA